jgi:hypothetical protein
VTPQGDHQYQIGVYISLKSQYSGFPLIEPPVNWGGHLFGGNPGEQKHIGNITRIRFAYLRHAVQLGQ